MLFKFNIGRHPLKHCLCCEHHALVNSGHTQIYHSKHAIFKNYFTNTFFDFGSDTKFIAQIPAKNVQKQL